MILGNLGEREAWLVWIVSLVSFKGFKDAWFETRGNVDQSKSEKHLCFFLLLLFVPISPITSCHFYFWSDPPSPSLLLPLLQRCSPESTRSTTQERSKTESWPEDILRTFMTELSLRSVILGSSALTSSQKFSTSLITTSPNLERSVLLDQLSSI